MPTKSQYVLYDKEHGKQFINNFKIYEVNLNKMKEVCYNRNINTNLLSILDLEKEELEKIEGDELVKKLKDEIIKLNQDEEFVEFLDDEEDARKTENSIKEEAIEQNSLEIAKKMLNEDISLDIISKITNLSLF